MRNHSLTGIVLVIGFFRAMDASALDWPQFRGINRDGFSAETGLAHAFAADGPCVVWRRSIGDGFSAVSAMRDILVTADSDGEGEYVLALDAKSGTTLWRTRIGDRFDDSWGNGPRSTPTLFGNMAFVVSGRGVVAAVRMEDGKLAWSVDMKSTYNAPLPTWGFSASPVVTHDAAIVEVGADGDHAVVAFSLSDGHVKWHAGHTGSAYNSPFPMKLGDATQVLFLNKAGVTALSVDGEPLWEYAWIDHGIKPASPVFVPPDLVFFSAAYGTGALTLKVQDNGSGFSVSEVWRDRMAMRNHFSSSLSIGGRIVGFDNATLKCLNPHTGEQIWSLRGGLGKGSLIAADGQLIVLSETGMLKLYDPAEMACRETASFQVLEGRCWTAPSLADGMLYLRSRNEVVKLDMRAQAVSNPASPGAGGAP